MSALLFPAVRLIGFLNYDASWHAIGWGGDLIRLRVMVPSYRLEIAKLPSDRGPRMKYFD